jgi:hypothetical protein
MYEYIYICVCVCVLALSSGRGNVPQQASGRTDLIHHDGDEHYPKRRRS